MTDAWKTQNCVGCRLTVTFAKMILKIMGYNGLWTNGGSISFFQARQGGCLTGNKFNTEVDATAVICQVKETRRLTEEEKRS